MAISVVSFTTEGQFLTFNFYRITELWRKTPCDRQKPPSRPWLRSIGLKNRKAQIRDTSSSQGKRSSSTLTGPAEAILQNNKLRRSSLWMKLYFMWKSKERLWPEKVDQDIFKIHFSKSNQLSNHCSLSLCSRLSLIKTTLVVSAQRRRCIRDDVSARHQTRHLSAGFGRVIATAGASTPQPLHRLTHNYRARGEGGGAWCTGTSQTCKNALTELTFAMGWGGGGCALCSEHVWCEAEGTLQKQTLTTENYWFFCSSC